jgi:hypothetical protein
MELQINEEEISLLLDVLAVAGANDQLPSGLYPFFWRVSEAMSSLPQVYRFI